MYVSYMHSFARTMCNKIVAASAYEHAHTNYTRSHTHASIARAGGNLPFIRPAQLLHRRLHLLLRLLFRLRPRLRLRLLCLVTGFVSCCADAFISTDRSR